MLKFYDDCMDSADWIEHISGYRPVDDCISLEDLENLQKENESVSNARMMFFDYPLSEIPYLFENDELFEGMQLVRFSNGYNGYEYRMCEIDHIMRGDKNDKV